MDLVEQDAFELQDWPPGTVRLEALQSDTIQKDLILQPRPTDDPNDPLNWPNWRKYWNFALASFYSMLVFAIVNAATPTWTPMGEQLGFSDEILNDSYAIGCATLAIGGFMLIPFALKFGRRPVYVVSLALQFAISIWQAKLQTVADLLLINAFECLLGALAEVLVQMTVADVFFVHQRGLTNTIYIWFCQIGSNLAPVVAGYITLIDWRWVWWVMAIMMGIGFITFALSYEETKFNHEKIDATPIISSPDHGDKPAFDSSSTKTSPREAVVEETSGVDLSVVHINPDIPRKTYWQRLAVTTTTHGDYRIFLRHGWQWFPILCTMPAVAFSALLYGVMLCYSCIMTTNLSTLMAAPPYNFDTAQIGLMSLPPFIGSSLGALVVGPLSDRLILYLARRNKGIYEPEMRLWAMVPFLAFVPAGALMFGFSLTDGRPWPIVAIGYGMTTFGTTPISSIALTYVTDSYQDIVADALVGVTFVRNALSTVFVFSMTPWVNNLGLKSVFIITTVIGCVVFLFTFVMIWYGKRLRARTQARYTYYSRRQFQTRT